MEFNIKDIINLCYKIDMPQGMIQEIEKNFHLIEKDKIIPICENLLNDKQAEEAYKTLKVYTDTLDENKVCELIVFLYTAILSYDKYIEKGINEKIYLNTMKCFSRFVRETYNNTNKYIFDRGFWAWRQLSLRIFRINELEFEIASLNDDIAKKINIPKEDKVLYVHIPSDAVCTNEKLNTTYKNAKIFFNEIFNKEYKILCSSWLLGKELEGFIKKDSGIYNFRKDYNMLDNYFESNDYLEWVFNKFEGDIKDFNAKTSLQKSIQQHILKGGKMTVGLGVLKNF